MRVNFAAVAEEAFRGLLDQFGFHKVRIEPTYSRWESKKLFISCRYDVGHSYEVFVELGELTCGIERPFSFCEFLRSQHVPESEWPTSYMALSPDALTSLLTQISSVLAKYGRAILSHENDSWESLAELRQRECIDFERDREIRYARKDAQLAWKNRDYQRFIILLEPFSDYLERSELAKLNYARSHR